MTIKIIPAISSFCFLRLFCFSVSCSVAFKLKIIFRGNKRNFFYLKDNHLVYLSRPQWSDENENCSFNLVPYLYRENNAIPFNFIIF